MKTRLALVPLLWTAILCGGCVTKGDSPVEPSGITSVDVTPGNRTAFVGEVIQYTATVVVQGNPPDQTVTWTSSNPSVATVDATGRVTTLAVGQTTIGARARADSSKAAAVTLTVIAQVPIVFNISATKTTDTGCNFAASFMGMLEALANSDGSNLAIRMIERLTRMYNGALNANGTFSATGSGNLEGFQYAGTIAGLATPTTIQGTETLNFTTGCPGGQVVYQFTGTR
jgi:hypothetical protein